MATKPRRVPGNAAPVADAKPEAAPQAATAEDYESDGLVDASEVDPSQIPFGQQVMTRQGWVVSTAEDPKRQQR